MSDTRETTRVSSLEERREQRRSNKSRPRDPPTVDSILPPNLQAPAEGEGGSAWEGPIELQPAAAPPAPEPPAGNGDNLLQRMLEKRAARSRPQPELPSTIQQPIDQERHLAASDDPAGPIVSDYAGEGHVGAADEQKTHPERVAREEGQHEKVSARTVPPPARALGAIALVACVAALIALVGQAAPHRTASPSSARLLQGSLLTGIINPLETFTSKRFFAANQTVKSAKHARRGQHKANRPRRKTPHASLTASTPSQATQSNAVSTATQTNAASPSTTATPAAAAPVSSSSPVAHSSPLLDRRLAGIERRLHQPFDQPEPNARQTTSIRSPGSFGPRHVSGLLTSEREAR
jgi:hypothetical protein